MTPQRKRAQMLLLEGAMHDVRMDFNHRFFALREVKRKVGVSSWQGVIQMQYLHVGASGCGCIARSGAPSSLITVLWCMGPALTTCQSKHHDPHTKG